MVDRFSDLADPGCYRPLPGDWHVAAADVVGSTRAIAAGRYEAVNTVAMARQAFGLELRAALVPVSWVENQGHEVLVARHRVSPHYEQCALQSALHGGGASLIEALLKTGGLPAAYHRRGWVRGGRRTDEGPAGLRPSGRIAGPAALAESLGPP